MKKITGRLFVRHESETEYRNWNDLTEEEKKSISRCLNKQAALGAGYKEKAS